MLSDLENARKMIELLGDEGFVDTLTNAEQLVDDVEETLGRVERIEGDAEQALREANDALNAVDHRLQKFDEAIRLIEAKIEAGFSIGFFFFALQQWTAGSVFIAAGLFVMGLLGASSLAVTIIHLPQIRRLWEMSQYLFDRLDEEESEASEVDIETREVAGSSDTERGSDGETGPTIDWKTNDSGGQEAADGQRDRGTGNSQRDRETADTQHDRRNSDGGERSETRRRRS